MMLEREPCVLRLHSCVVNGQSKLFVLFARRRADVGIERRDARRKRCGRGVELGNEPSFRFALRLLTLGIGRKRLFYHVLRLTLEFDAIGPLAKN